MYDPKRTVRLILKPMQGLAKVVIENAVFPLAKLPEGDPGQISQSCIRNQNSFTERPILEQLPCSVVEFFLRQCKIDGRRLHFQSVVEYARVTRILKQLDYPFVCFFKHAFG